MEKRLFDTEYPQAPLHFQIPIEDYNVFRGRDGHEENCGHCHEPTHWFDIDFQVAVCSHECLGALWDEYIQALRAEGPPTEEELNG